MANSRAAKNENMVRYMIDKRYELHEYAYENA
jgi:hypothetical protein